MNSSRTCMLYFDKLLLQLLFLISFTTSFCRQHSLMNKPCYNNLFQIMQNGNFWNLNGVNFTKWKHLECQFSAFWYCFKVIKRNCWNRFRFQKTKALLKYCNCFIHGVIKVYWYYFLVPMLFTLCSGTIQF